MSGPEIHSHDVVIEGGGLAGLRGALECIRSLDDVAVVSKVHLLRSHSTAGGPAGSIRIARRSAQKGVQPNVAFAQARRELKGPKDGGKDEG